MGPAREKKSSKPGRPKLPPVHLVKIGEREYEITFKALGLSKDTPFRAVYMELLKRAGAEVPE